MKFKAKILDCIVRNYNGWNWTIIMYYAGIIMIYTVLGAEWEYDNTGNIPCKDLCGFNCSWYMGSIGKCMFSNELTEGPEFIQKQSYKSVYPDLGEGVLCTNEYKGWDIFSHVNQVYISTRCDRPTGGALMVDEGYRLSPYNNITIIGGKGVVLTGACPIFTFLSTVDVSIIMVNITIQCTSKGSAIEVLGTSRTFFSIDGLNAYGTDSAVLLEGNKDFRGIVSGFDNKHSMTVHIHDITGNINIYCMSRSVVWVTHAGHDMEMEYSPKCVALASKTMANTMNWTNIPVLGDGPGPASVFSDLYIIFLFLGIFSFYVVKIR